MAGGVRVGEGATAGVLTGAERLELAGAEAELGVVDEVELLAADAQPAVSATHSSAAAWTPRLAAPGRPVRGRLGDGGRGTGGRGTGGRGTARSGFRRFCR